MLLYLAIAFTFFYTNTHGIIMDFTLNTIMGDRDCHDYANFVMRSCLFVTRANSKSLSLGWSFHKKRGRQTGSTEDEEDSSSNPNSRDEDVCVVSFQKSASKNRNRGNKALGSGLLTFLDHRDSVVVYNDRHNNKNRNLKNKRCDDDDDDDETASTVDMDEDEFPVSALSSSRNAGRQSQRTVQFQRELVTAVYTRPRTTKEDKYYLHYDEYDYMDFKLEYRDDLLHEQRQKRDGIGSQRRRSSSYRRSPRKVSFKREVVDSVHPVMDRDQRKQIQNDLFYTEEEMRTFLDEFVASLQNQSMQQQLLQAI